MVDGSEATVLASSQILELGQDRTAWGW